MLRTVEGDCPYTYTCPISIESPINTGFLKAIEKLLKPLSYVVIKWFSTTLQKRCGASIALHRVEKEGVLRVDSFTIIIAVIVIVPMLIMAFYLLNGKGAFLISGYNTMGKAAKEQYDEKALCRFMGRLLIVVCFCMALTFAGAYFGITLIIHLGIALIVVFSFGGAIYANTGKRFLKKDADLEVVKSGIAKSRKTTVIVTVVISLITIIGLGALFYYGEKEPIVNIFDDSIQIRGMYGLTVDFSEISNVFLLEQNMREIGVGRRTNGYANGNTLKGHFTSGRLFVQADISPTIRIERYNSSNIYINFRDSEQTEILYNDLRAAAVRGGYIWGYYYIIKSG